MSQTRYISVSDRRNFRRCRRRWDWSSSLRQDLEPIGPMDKNSFIGHAVHYALQDFHGRNTHADPRGAARHWIAQVPESSLPRYELEGLKGLIHGMLGHYVLDWDPRRGAEYTTVWEDGEPLVEVEFEVPIPDSPAMLKVVIDRVVQDDYGRWFVMDYKTVGKFDTTRWDLDDQLTSYIYAARHRWGDLIEGAIVQQHVKAYPDAPKRLARGGFSKDKRQNVTHAGYRDALLAEFGRVPSEYIDYLNDLALEPDRFIRRDVFYRNPTQIVAETIKMAAEAQDMLDPKLPLYPNPTRDCAFDCAFRQPCIERDSGGDYKWLLRANYQKRKRRTEAD